ncbi:sulfite exporter TauE/SafE family protein [Chitinolyticbacter meiyuanensis]|uniref:sulfite exporter TauE/SafE family protein n=1 Tax=Chitinolyticbacter meiyuanensis TaxID=682798 RepID=UPI001C9E27F3|nr:sulfite exporter TauE/SafE family protein [Chitinolyticbacter meiyuanensis]
MDVAPLAMLLLIAATLYAAVGHGGASAYLAVMALAGIPPAVMKPSALALNLVVAAIALFRFYRAGSFRWTLFWPLVFLSIPCAYLGGRWQLPATLYKPVLGVMLLYAGAQIAWQAKSVEQRPLRDASRPGLLGFGAMLGGLSGLTGVGGGIFLSPLLYWLRWAAPRTIAATSAAFIWMNSAAGLLGVYHIGQLALPAGWPLWAVCVALGGWLGAGLGSCRLAVPQLQWALALVLVIAGGKLLLS